MKGAPKSGRGIIQHRHELAIVARVPYPDKINVIPFSSDEIVLVISPKSKLVKKESISMYELAEEPSFALIPDQPQNFLSGMSLRNGLAPSAIIEAGNTEFIKQLVKKNKGYSFLASLCVRDEIRRGELATLALDEGKFLMDIDVIHLKGKTLSPAASTFLHFIQAYKDPGNLVKFTDEISKIVSIA